MLLTLYILTRNSPENLGRMLDSLLPWEDRDDVEIIVGDNSDDRRVADLVVERSGQFGGRIRCLKHVCNLGYTANMMRGFEVARGRYLWIVGSNDRFHAGALAYLMALLGHREDALILFPVEGLKARPWPLEKVFDDFADAVRELELGPINSINACVFRREVFLRYLPIGYEGNLIPQTTMIAAALRDGQRLYFHPKALIDRLPRSVRIWDPRRVWMNYWLIYPDPNDRHLWNKVRGLILRDWSRWILNTEKEGFTITVPLAMATWAQFGIRSLPLVARMVVRIMKRKQGGRTA